MEGPSGSEEIRAAPAAIRQRWRLVYRRAGWMRTEQRTQREEALDWESAIIASGIPVAGLDTARGRPRIQLGPPLGAGIVGERELADLFLTRRVTRASLHEALDGHLPPGVSLVDLHDVWTGAPALPSAVIAADYRVELGMEAPDAAEIEAAALRLLAARAIPRDRVKGGGVRRYDLRPLVTSIAVHAAGPPVVLLIRTRLDPQLGHGRPEEVLSALADLAQRPCPASSVVRERLLVADEV